MTGAYLRVNRNGKWENIEVEHLTDKEREELFTLKDKGEMLAWLNMVCLHLASIENQMEAGK